jgi:hypothetical protein
MEKVVIVSGVRTPIGAYGGTLKDLHVTKYAGLALNEAVKRAKIEPDRVDDVIMGQSYQNVLPGVGPRQVLYCGLEIGLALTYQQWNDVPLFTRVFPERQGYSWRLGGCEGAVLSHPILDVCLGENNRAPH